MIARYGKRNLVICYVVAEILGTLIYGGLHI